MATGKSGGGNIFDRKTPPGDALLAKEQAALARQQAGKNPSVDVTTIPGRVLRAVGPPKNPTLVDGKPVSYGIVFTPATAAIQTAADAPKIVRNARDAARKAIQPGSSDFDRLNALLSGGFGLPRMGVNHKARTVTFQGKTQQLPRARSSITGVGERLIDRASVALHETPHVKDLPGLRLLTVGERVAKHAGREQRQERVRAAAAQAEHLNALKAIKAGSAEDQANFWYAQLPASHRNGTGLSLVRARQAEELQRITSGEALAALNAQEQAVKARLGEAADLKEKGPLLQELDDIKVAKTDLPQRADDISASLAQLDGLIEKPPPVNAAAIRAVHALGQERKRILLDAGRLNPERAANRDSLIPRWLKLPGYESRPLQDASDAALHQRARDLGDWYDGLVGDLAAAEGKPYAGVTRLQNRANGKSVRRGRGKVYEDQSETLRRQAEAKLQQAVEANPKDPTVRAIAERLDELGAIQLELARRADVALGLEDASASTLASGLDAPTYIGHRLPKTAGGRFPYVPPGGVGRVKSPAGVGSENKLVLASTGRLRPSLHVAGEDWASAQVFQQANVARRDLAEMGAPFTGHVPEGHSLVNPKGRTVPPDWKNEDLAQFQDGYEDIDTIREQAKKILDGFIATDRAGFDRMKQEALEQGVDWSELRVVPDRLVNRYYSQFRPLRTRGTAGKVYDSAIDAVATSIVFARVGYIPKNLVQNLILALPHQGPMLPINAVRAAQAMADPKLRALLQAEVGNTGATGALGREAFTKQLLGKLASGVSKVADDPVRMSAFMHEAAAAGVIGRANPLLTEHDRTALLRLFTDKSQRALLNDIRSRTVEAMADFSRLTPDQSRMARRFLIIPGWLMAGTRYPFHFAATHPIRSGLLAYIALGEPGAPDELHFNHPINEYFTGTSYRQGIETPWGRERTGSLSPVSTPWEIGGAAVGSVRGKKGPFDYTTPQLFDLAQPLAASLIRLTQGEGVARSLTPLAPNYKLARDLISPDASATYPEDATRIGRLKRELGVIPIRVNDPRKKTGNVFDDDGSSGSGDKNIFDK